jgi:hypothetical protein
LNEGPEGLQSFECLRKQSFSVPARKSRRSLHANGALKCAGRTVAVHLIGGHRHGIDTIRLQIMTVARWATLARRLQSA